jgi:hypothetical protein
MLRIDSIISLSFTTGMCFLLVVVSKIYFVFCVWLCNEYHFIPSVAYTALCDENVFVLKIAKEEIGKEIKILY